MPRLLNDPFVLAMLGYPVHVLPEHWTMDALAWLGFVLTGIICTLGVGAELVEEFPELYQEPHDQSDGPTKE
ncbi:hypothetical protein [Alicyclobacillus macrosporangiidus]|uniref:hypothetical protein n=1 Tax=Alicyclobacillus macrosporangiidus TaxID=392015 RepID=UPI0004966A1D|nr:hypothetical protein [Alicyclobacillus macrosporangiidus]